MGEAATFDKCIFISYCHADNENPLGEGWIGQFHEVLKVRLKQILGARRPEEEPGIWRDKELQGNEQFEGVLHEKLRGVSIVLSILSPSYVRSEWCKREVEAFVEAAESQGGLVVDHKTRIFKILKDPVDRDELPTPLQDQLGYEFFVRDGATGTPQEFTLLRGDTNTPLAMAVFNDLAHAIVDTLSVLQDEGVLPSSANQDTPPHEAPALSEKRAVYLAETSFDLEEDHRTVRRALEGAGFEVLPASELPLRNPARFENAVSEALSRCELSVHMFGAQRAPVVSGSSDDIAVAQNTLAVSLPGRSIARIIWMPPDVEAADETQAETLNTLHLDAGGADVLQGPVQELLTVVQDALERKQPQERAASSEDHSSIYVLYAAEDAPAMEGILDHLFQLQHDVLEPLLDPQASDAQVQEIHKRNLQDCDGVLLYAASAGQFWIQTQMSELKRAALWREGRPFSVQGIFMGPGCSISPRRLRSHDFILMQQKGDFDPGQLAPFLDSLGVPAP